MPMTNDIIMELNKITNLVQNKTTIAEEEIGQIKHIFKKILQKNQTYNTDEIKSWFENEGSWSNKESITRIVNISHYLQDKYEQNNKLNMMKDSCDCD